MFYKVESNQIKPPLFPQQM